MEELWLRQLFWMLGTAPLQSAGGFISVVNWTRTETSLFYSLFIEVGVFSAEIINKIRRERKLLYLYQMKHV